MSPLSLSLAHSPELVDPVLRDELEHLQVQVQTWAKTVEFPGLSASSALVRWVPVLGGAQGASGQGYAVQYGLYTTLGRLVLAHFAVVLQQKGTIAGPVELQGLPVAASTEPYDTFLSSALRWVGFATTWVQVYTQMRPNTTRAEVLGTRTAATHNGTVVMAADLSDVAELRGMLVYFGRGLQGG